MLEPLVHFISTGVDASLKVSHVGPNMPSTKSCASDLAVASASKGLSARSPGHPHILASSCNVANFLSLLWSLKARGYTNHGR